jgi:hypothetical protein
MSILIEYYGTGGGGSTPTLQQVLTAGSILSANNSIQVSYNTSFDFDLNSGAQLYIGAINKDGVMYFDMTTSGAGYNETYAKQSNGLAMVRNYFEINPNLKQYNFGDFQQLSNGTFMTIDDVSERVNIKGGVDIINTTNNFSIEETSLGNGKIYLSGTGYVNTSINPTTNAGHLKIFVNGATRWIALKS